MNKYDCARRLKRMVHEECKINELETKIARKSAKYYQQMANLKTSLNKQELELSVYRKQISNLKHVNAKLERHIQKEEALLCTTIQRMDQMQTEYKNTLQQQIDQRRSATFELDCIRSLKSCTQTYINMSALPSMVQGVTLCEKETSSDWKPFCIDPLNHTQKEIQDIIWHDTQLESVYRDKWEKLILSDILEESKVDMETDNGNINVSISA